MFTHALCQFNITQRDSQNSAVYECAETSHDTKGSVPEKIHSVHLQYCYMMQEKGEDEENYCVHLQSCCAMQGEGKDGERRLPGS